MQGNHCAWHGLRGAPPSRGRHPSCQKRVFQLGILAILLHDSGYLKRANDANGTGAKYTATHVDRSADFAGELLTGQGYAAHDITAVQNMIRCTGVNASIAGIPFQTLEERIAGSALATADYLGQHGGGRLRGETAYPLQGVRRSGPVFWRAPVINGFAMSTDLIRKTRLWGEIRVEATARCRVHGIIPVF